MTLRVAMDVSCALERPPTGVGYAARYLVTALAQSADGPELRLFATRSGKADAEVPEWAGLHLAMNTIPRAGHLKHIAWTRTNWPPIEWFTGPCDIAHGLFHLVPAARKALRIVTIHDLSFLLHPEMHTHQTVRAHNRLVLHAALNADAIITVSEQVRREVLEHFRWPEDRVYAVPNGVDTAEFAPPVDLERQEALRGQLGLLGPYMMYVGTLEPRKNLPALIRAWASVHDSIPGFDLLLAGKRGWKTDAIEETMLQYGAGSRVVCAGHLDRRDIVCLLQGARACLYPSLYEGFGLPVLEAMAAGTPVMTSSISAMPEVAGDAALLVDPRDESAMAHDILELATDNELVAHLRERGHQRAAQFTWRASAERLMTVYRALT